MEKSRKKVLVTGADGFIGKVLVSNLESRGITVTRFDMQQGDISDIKALAPLADQGIEHVFHLAGRTFVPESWNDPFGFYRVNVMGTVNVLEFCRETRAGLTYVSSYLYGEPEYLPIDESHPLKSYNPYSQSKLLADDTCRFYAKHYGLKVSVFRPFNAYGPGQKDKFLIPEIIQHVMDPAVPVIEVMDLRPRRDYVFVDDLVEAFIVSLEKAPGIFNIGSGYSKSVEEIILQVMELSGLQKEYRAIGESRPYEIFDLYADIRKARDVLGWAPKTSFEEGIRQCIRAYAG
jgi:nucleoside-diphosphate-sugar epimerase